MSEKQYRWGDICVYALVLIQALVLYRLTSIWGIDGKELEEKVLTVFLYVTGLPVFVAVLWLITDKINRFKKSRKVSRGDES